MADSLLAIDPQSVSAEAVGEQGWRIELVAATLGWSPISTANRLATAQRLVIELPHMVGLLAGGEVSVRHALVLAEEVAELTPFEMSQVEARVLERAPNQTAGQFTRSVRRAVFAVAPQAAASRRAKAIRARGVRTVVYPDGMAAVVATMGAVEADIVFRALDAAARNTAAAQPADTTSTAGSGSAGRPTINALTPTPTGAGWSLTPSMGTCSTTAPASTDHPRSWRTT